MHFLPAYMLMSQIQSVPLKEDKKKSQLGHMSPDIIIHKTYAGSVFMITVVFHLYAKLIGWTASANITSVYSSFHVLQPWPIHTPELIKHHRPQPPLQVRTVSDIHLPAGRAHHDKSKVNAALSKGAPNSFCLFVKPVHVTAAAC